MFKNFNMKDNLDFIRNLNCSVCLAPPPSDPHHLKTRGAGGTDELGNLVSLCRKCHTTIHQAGRETFLKRHRMKINEFRRFYDLPEV